MEQNEVTNNSEDIKEREISEVSADQLPDEKSNSNATETFEELPMLNGENEDGEVSGIEIMEVKEKIHLNTGMYWAAGSVTTKQGNIYPLILQISSDDAGEVFGAYWKIEDVWHKQNDEGFLKAVGLKQKEIFPVHYEVNVEFEGGIRGGKPINKKK